MAKYDYNIVSIGAGSAGLVTSYIGAILKAKVALIERHKMGGDCLNTGCVPSKALIKTAKVIQSFKKHKIYGLEDASYRVNFKAVMEQVQAVIRKIEPHDSVERYSKLGVECYKNEARLLSPHEIELDDGKKITAKNIVIATGARPAVFPIAGLDSLDYVHSDNIWELKELPKRMLFLGGGPIGCELAQCFSRLGSKVTIIDIAPTILPREDPEIARFVIDSFEKDGINFIGEAKIDRFEKNSDAEKVYYEKEGKNQVLEFDKIFLGTGRQANTKGLGIEELGIELNSNKTLKVNDYLQTTVPNIYGCGDVVGPFQFTHMAAHQAWYCAVNSLFSPFKKFKVDYSVVPWVTYTDPEVAQVGENEISCQQKGMAFEVTRYGVDDLDRAIADREDKGIVKVITVPKKDQILGCTICAQNAGEMIGEFILAMRNKIGLNKILGTIHPYPTMIEANKYAAGQWKSAHAPQGILNFLGKFHSWRR